MDRLLVFGDYLSWHYAGAFRDIIRLWGNMLWFLNHFFSIPVLARTLFAPFKRVTTKSSKGADIQDIVESLLFNGITRLVGAFMRLGLIITGVVFLITALVGGVVILVVWGILPILILFLLSRGFTSFLPV